MEGGRERDLLGSVSLQNPNIKSLCKLRRCPIQVVRHFENSKENFTRLRIKTLTAMVQKPQTS